MTMQYSISDIRLFNNPTYILRRKEFVIKHYGYIREQKIVLLVVDQVPGYGRIFDWKLVVHDKSLDELVELEISNVYIDKHGRYLFDNYKEITPIMRDKNNKTLIDNKLSTDTFLEYYPDMGHLLLVNG